MLLLIDKPKGITSHDVIDQLRRISGIKRIGHAGTLDPNATGLLIVGVGRESTKKLGVIAKNTTKVYEATICLGEERDSDDSEGTIINKIEHIIPAREDVVKNMKKFVGEIDQIPPTYSAIKISGKKMYQLARKNIEFSPQPRKVMIHSIKLVHYKYPIIQIKCSVSSGTYIRALARDLGKSLRTGAYLKELRRTQIGEYKIINAIPLNQVKLQDFGDKQN
jgi:tRNA pseudouridine55 synthase